MSFNRYARRADATTQQIVDELRAVGFEVSHIGRPVDIAVRWPTWPPAMHVLMECKSPKGKAQVLKLRNDQKKQQEYCERNGVPYVLTGKGALTWLKAYAPPFGHRELPTDFEVKHL